jgi:hypothetical protein
LRGTAINPLDTFPRRRRLAHAALVILATAAWHEARLVSQTMTVAVVNGAVQPQAPGFRFIDGEPLARLRDGQSVRVELELSVLASPGAAAIVQRRQAFVLSYDLWEERFAVSMAGNPSRAMSHLTSAAAEAWCLQQLAVPVSELGGLGRSEPFWMRLEYRVPNGGAARDTDDGGFTLRGMIEALSRRRQTGDVTRAIEGGPFRIQQ